MVEESLLTLQEGLQARDILLEPLDLPNVQNYVGNFVELQAKDKYFYFYTGSQFEVCASA